MGCFSFLQTTADRRSGWPRIVSARYRPRAASEPKAVATRGPSLLRRAERCLSRAGKRERTLHRIAHAILQSPQQHGGATPVPQLPPHTALNAQPRSAASNMFLAMAEVGRLIVGSPDRATPPAKPSVSVYRDELPSTAASPRFPWGFSEHQAAPNVANLSVTDMIEYRKSIERRTRQLIEFCNMRLEARNLVRDEGAWVGIV